MSESKNKNYLHGAAILAVATIIVKIIGAIYKVPLYNLLGEEGTSHFGVINNVYSLILTISTAGIPIALSRLVSESLATDHNRQVKRFYSVAMPAFIVIGVICMALMAIFRDELAALMGSPEISLGILVLAPAVFFACLISVYRGYFQGFGDMVPTAVSQLVEVLCKTVVGFVIVWILLNLGQDSATLSAGAIAGTTAGLALCIPVFMFFKSRQNRKTPLIETGPEPLGRRESLNLIAKISAPITLSASITTILVLIDTALILHRLQAGAGLSYETAKILNGVYVKVHSLYNLPLQLIVPLTVSVVPAITAAVASRRAQESKSIIASSIKITNLLAMPAGVGLLVLAYPILYVLWPESNENGTALLAMLGIVSYFACINLTTTAILQAAGFEKFTLYIIPLAGLIRIALSWFLIGNPAVNIFGAPIAALVYHIFITAAQLIYIARKVPNAPPLSGTFVKPVLCTGIMGLAAWAVYGLCDKFLSGFFDGGRLPLLIFLCAAIGVAVLVYALLIIVSGAITREDLKLIPKGEKLANLLKIK